MRGGDYHDRTYCGAGPLENLIRADPARFIERIESAANNDHTFQDALAGVWITLEEVTEPLARRYYIASGHQLRVLDAPPDW